ncbi:MAG: thermonuclease family protein [Reyranellales bacterium]
MRWFGKAIAGIAALAALPAAAQTVIDGDTLKLNGTTFRLWGIDAPEANQTCSDGWQAGKIASAYLAGLIQGRSVICEPKDQKADDGSRFAVCKVDGQDLAASMASAGMAWAYIRYSQDYVVQDSNAMSALLGVHANACMKAWEWRTRSKPKPS